MAPSVNNGRRSGGGQSSPPGLEQQAEVVLDRERWPTPSVMDSAGFHGKPDKGRTSPNSGQTLAGATEGAARRRRLNPRFVEWLMGLPPGWTDFAPLETESSHSRPSTPSASCGAESMETSR